MKSLIAMALVLVTTSSYAINIDAGNNMAQEPAPARDSSSTMSDRRVYNNNSTTYGSEMNDRRTIDDNVSTGQSSTRRTNSVDTPATQVRPAERCIDRNGYSYSRNDSGYAACVNQGMRR